MKATLILIQNDADHAQAKAHLAKLMASKEADAAARISAQAQLIAAYERTRWPRRLVTLPDVLNYVMDQHGMKRTDLVPILGTVSRVSEILGGKRALSMTMVRKLRDHFHISADVLIPPAPAFRRRARAA